MLKTSARTLLLMAVKENRLYFGERLCVVYS